MRRWFFTGLQIVGSVVLLALVLRQVPFSELAAQRVYLTWEAILTAFALYVLSYMVTVYNWHFILGGLGVHQPFRDVLGAHLSGNFYGTVVPSSLSSDVGRGVRLHTRLKDTGRITLSILIDRFSGLVVLGAVLVISTPFYLQVLPFDITQFLSRAVVWVGVVVVGIAALVVAYWLFPGWFAPRIQAVWALRSHWRIFLVAIVLTVLVHLLVAAMLWVLVRIFWPGAPFWFCLYLTELLQIAEILPVSVAGLGVREGLYVLMLGIYGVSQAQAITVSLVQFVLFVLVAMLGGLHELSLGLHSLTRRVQSSGD